MFGGREMNQIKKIRQKIDSLDMEILQKLDLRFSLAKKTIKYKSHLQDKKRETDILNQIKSHIRRFKNLREVFVLELFQMILKESLYLQNLAVMEKKEKISIEKKEKIARDSSRRKK